MTPKIYSARWVLPISSETIEDGAVAISDSLIAGVGTRAEITARFPDAPVENFGEAAILPGFVNCHSHLELTAMRGFLEREEGDFFAWLKKLTLARHAHMTADDLYVSAACGVVEAVRAGVTSFGDASTTAATVIKALRDVGARGIVFQEAFGPDPRIAREQFELVRDGIAPLRDSESELVKIGISPHAPYTVSAPLLELITDYALAERLPVMMHAAESQAEKLLLLEGRGDFADGMRERGIEWRTPGVSTIKYLHTLGVLEARPLLAHCIHVDEADMALIKEAGAGVAHCPKSNAKLGHGRAHFAAFIRAGLNVGFGSDSVASNNTCDLLEEARFATLLSRSAGDTLDNGRMVNATDALRAATMGGAHALGLGDRIGALAEGFDADLIAVSLSGAHQQPVHDPNAALVFASTGRDVLLTVVAGREVFRDAYVQTIDEVDLRVRLQDCAQRMVVA